MSRLQRIASAKSFYQSSELYQIHEAKEGSLLAHDDLRIRGNGIRPLWWYRANGTFINLKQ